MDLPRLLPKATLKPEPYIERPSGDDKYDLRSQEQNTTIGNTPGSAPSGRRGVFPGRYRADQPSTVTTFFDEPSNPMPSNEEEAVC